MEGSPEPEEYNYTEVRDGHGAVGISEAEYNVMYELFEALGIDEDSHYSQWPEEVGSIFHHNGFIVVTLTEFTQENVDKYCGMVTDSNYLRFARASFSHAEIGCVMDQIASEEAGYPGYDANVFFKTSTLEEPHIVYHVPSAYFDIMQTYFKTEYGDIVEVATDR